MGAEDEYRPGGANEGERWHPLPLDYLMTKYSLKNGAFLFLLVIWIILIGISIASIIVVPPSQAFLTGVGQHSMYTFFMMYPPLILGTLLLYWLGFEWGFIPVFLSAFVIAYTSYMPVHWAILFGLSFVLGLTIHALCYYSIPISPRLNSLASVAFFVTVEFVASLASSLGSFVWSLFHNLSAAETITIWKGWWTGVFLQSIVFVGPLLYFFTPAFDRLKERHFVIPEIKVSLKWIYTAIISVVIVLTLFIGSAYVLGFTGLEEELAQLPGRFEQNFMKVTDSFQIISLISICLVLAAGLGGIYLVGSWNKTLSDTVKDHTRRLKESQGVLKIALSERDTLLKEIHNRVGNNLTMMLALLELQLKTGDDKPVEDILKDSHSRLRSMAVIYETMHQTESTNFVNLKKYTLKLSNRLSQSFKEKDRNIDVSIKADDIKLEIDRAVPFGVILNELLVNSHVHAFKGQNTGTIFVEIKRENGHLALNVRDNGVGLPSRFDIHEPETLGMKLILTLTRQLNGEFKLDPQNKTGFTFRMPIVGTSD